MPGVVSLLSVGRRATPKSVSTHRPSSADEYVRRLDVAVQHAGRVGDLQRAEHGDADLGDGALGQRPVVDDHVGEAARLQQLHDDPRPATVGDHVVDLHHAGVRQRRGGPGLPQRALAERVPFRLRHRGGSRTSLTATSRRSSVSLARQTVPMPPCPMGVRSAYRPPTTVPGAARSPAGRSGLPRGLVRPGRNLRRHGRRAVLRWSMVSRVALGSGRCLSLYVRRGRSRSRHQGPILRDDAPEEKSRGRPGGFWSAFRRELSAAIGGTDGCAA